MKWQDDIIKLLDSLGESYDWLAENTGLKGRSQVHSYLKRVKTFKKEYSDWYKDAKDILLTEHQQRGIKPPMTEPESNNEILSYLIKKVKCLEEENEKLSKENQVLRVQFSQIEDAGKRLRQGKS